MMNNNKNTVDIKDREKIAKEIVKTSNSIRKKYRALKTGKMIEDAALEKHFKPIIQPLEKIVDNTTDNNSKSWKDEIPSMNTSTEAKSLTLKPEEKEEKKQEKKLKHKAKLSDLSWDYSDIPAMTSPKRKRLNDPPASTSTMEAFQYEQPSGSSPINILPIEEGNVFETPDESFAMSIRHELQTPEGQQMLHDHFGRLGQIYMGAVLNSEKDSNIDNVYGVRLSNDGAMLGDKRIDVDRNDNILIDGIKYQGTPGIYELIFKRLPDDTVYTKADLQKYKNILLATNAHRRGHNPQNSILGNRGYKYKHVIAPLVSRVPSNKAKGKGLSQTMKGLPQAMMLLDDNTIDYVHWNDPNELVDRLRLLDASSRAGNNAHDNEILSIIEELREAGLIIN